MVDGWIEIAWSMMKREIRDFGIDLKVALDVRRARKKTEECEIKAFLFTNR